METSGATGSVALSYIVPAHNSADVIEGTLKELADRLEGTGSEILVVENGSSDGTFELLTKVAETWSQDVELRVLQSAKGMGNALRAGIKASKGQRLFLGADDIPFGFDDLDAAEKLAVAQHPMVIGSKGHKDSVTPRGMARRILTLGFLTLRLVILGMRTRDPQGTFIIDGEWARSVESRLTEQGFLLTTELTFLAEREGIRTTEVPVRLRASHDVHGSRIRLSDPVKMGLGLFTLRRKHPRKR
jgi:glycosyltransferase involved in cell wall biosynthesis